METPQEQSKDPLDDIVLAIKRSPEGLMILMRPKTRSELVMAFGELQLAIMNEIVKINEHVRASKDGKQSILNFARRIK